MGQTAAMRTASATALFVLAAACHPGSEQQRVGWHYRAPSSEAVARIDYVFEDPNTRFIGRCDGGPTFVLFGGEYAHGAPAFTLTIDGRSWELPVSYHAHGRFLRVDNPDPQMALIHAQRMISFRVGNWQRQFRPSPLLQQYARDCP